MPVPFIFDFKNPDYRMVFEYRAERLMRIRKNPECLGLLIAYYRDNPVQFINDWGCTSDPRNPERGLPTVIPFILFPRQEEAVEWIFERWRTQTPGIMDKSRDMGLSWITCAVAVTMCCLFDGIQIGFGSRKEEYVDKGRDPKTIFYKLREFTSLLPYEFNGAWDERKNSVFKCISYTNTQSVITGEAGRGIGRGDRKAIYIVDEAAWLEHPDDIESSLSNTTNCRIDVSTPRGMSNPFAIKRWGGKISVFTMHWRDDPRKDQAWYDKKVFDLDNPVVVAQEIDLDYSASIEGVVIPSVWVQAAIDAHITLGIEIVGKRRAGLDVADEGKDLNALAAMHGILLDNIEEFSGKNSDLFATTERACSLLDEWRYAEVDYDSDGLGASVRGDARVINEKRLATNRHKIKFKSYRGSGKVIYPDKIIWGDDADKGNARTNKDYFANFKAQAWWFLREKFRLTYRWVKYGEACDPTAIISISSKIPKLHKVCTELSQAQYKQNTAGQMLIDKQPDGTPSPNNADAIVIANAPREIRSSLFNLDDDDD